jgi:hypothetical protein
MENRHLRSLADTRFRSWTTLKEIEMSIRDVIFLGAMFGSATVGADPSVVTSAVERGTRFQPKHSDERPVMAE